MLQAKATEEPDTPAAPLAVSKILGWLLVAGVFGCAALLAGTPTVSVGARLMTNAIIMGGTTFPVPSQGYMESAINDFIAPTVAGEPGYTSQALWTPERVVGINQSVDEGAAELLDEIVGRQGPVVVFGFSQSTVIQMRVKAELEARRARGEQVPDVTFVGIGVGNRPNGGISQRFAGVTIPFFDFTFDGPAPTDTAFTTIDIARQYDGLADTPQFPINLVSTANALLGIVFVHALYGEEVSLDPDSPKYVPGTVEQQYGDTTYYWIPTADLPLFDPLRLVGVPEQAIDIVEPFVKVVVETGYDRSIPFGEPTPAQLIPVIDPVTFTIQLATAIVEGAANAAAIVGGQLPGYESLIEQLGTAESRTATVIGTPYRGVVTQLNDHVNPFQAFAAIEGPAARAVGSVLNPLGVPWAVNSVIERPITSLTGWAEANILFPQPDTPSNLLTKTAIDVLRRVAPHLGSTGAANADTGPRPDTVKRPSLPRLKQTARAAPSTHRSVSARHANTPQPRRQSPTQPTASSRPNDDRPSHTPRTNKPTSRTNAASTAGTRDSASKARQAGSTSPRRSIGHP